MIVLKLDAIVQKFTTILVLCRKRIQYPHSTEIRCAGIEHPLAPKLATQELGIQRAIKGDYERAKDRRWFRSGLCLKVSTSKYQCDRTQRGHSLKAKIAEPTATYPNLIAKNGTMTGTLPRSSSYISTRRHNLPYIHTLRVDGQDMK